LQRALSAILGDLVLQLCNPISTFNIIHAFGFTLLVGEKHAPVGLQAIHFSLP
jgi:hypothetical protein